jgi:large subunit ribosomal protein L1
MEAIRKAKPAGAKGSYIRRVTIASTMAPGIKVDATVAQALKIKE